MEFGIFHEFPSLPGCSDAESFAAAFDVVDGAEKWGLDAIWLAELHFDPERSVAVVADVHRQRDRGAHRTDEDRPRGAGAAAVQSAADR